MIFLRNQLCAFLSSGGLRLAGPNEDGSPSIRRLEQTQLEDFHPVEGWFLLDSCSGSKSFKKVNKKKIRRFFVEGEIQLGED